MADDSGLPVPPQGMPTTALSRSGKMVKALTPQLIKERWEKGQDDLRARRRDFEVNQAFFGGEQWVVWDAVSNRLEIDFEGEERFRASVNRLRPALSRQAAKINARPLTFQVVPTSVDDATAGAAKLAAAVCEHTAREHNWGALREHATWATRLGSTAVLAIEWDESAGTSLGWDADANVEVGTGDTHESVLTLHEVAFEPGTKDARQSRWWIKAAALPPEEVQARYQLDEAPQPDATAAMLPGAWQMRVLADKDQAGYMPELTMVWTYYERPNFLRPQGAVIVVVGNEIVGQGVWPFPFTDRLNVVVITEIPSLTHWTGYTAVSDAIGPQRALNHAWSSIIENAKAHSAARLMLPETANVEEGLVDDPFVPLVYTPGANSEKPEFLAPPSLPSFLMQLPERMEGEIDQAIGDFDVARGRSSGSVTSGSGLALLAEQGDMPISNFARKLADAFGTLASDLLTIYEAKVSDEREASVNVGGDVPAIMRWTGASLLGQTNAYVPFDAVAPRSGAALTQLATELWQMGVITDVSDFARFSDLPGLGDMLSQVDADAAKSLRENHEFAAGGMPIPATFDNHMKHVRFHNAFRATPTYERMDPQQRAMFDAHVQGHETYAAEELAMQQQREMLLPGLSGVAQADAPPSLMDVMAGVPGGLPVQGGMQPTPQLQQAPPEIYPEQPQPQRVG